MNRLKGKKRISLLFSEGKTIQQYPLRLVFIKSDLFSFGVSVGKKHFKQAVERNRIKRVLRTLTRKTLFSDLEAMKKQYDVMLIYIGKEMPKKYNLEDVVKKLGEKLKRL